MFSTKLAVSALALSFPLVAQVPTTTSAPATTALTIKSSDAYAIEAILDMVEFDGDAPELAEGEMAVISLDDGGNPIVSKTQGSGYFMLDCSPAQLMEMFSAQVEQGQQMAQMMGPMMGAQMGMGMDEMNSIVDGAFNLPTQIARLQINVPENPEETMALDADLHLTPVANTWMGKTISMLKPRAEGLNSITTDDAAFAMDMAIDMPAIADQLMSAMTPFVGFGQETKADKEKALGFLKTGLQIMDGTVSATFEPGGAGMRYMAGLLDAVKMSSLLDDEGYQQMNIAMATVGDQAEAEVFPKALEHRGVGVQKMVVTYDMENPMANEDGEVVSYSAVAGSMMLANSMGGGDNEIKAMIDGVQDNKFAKKKLPANVLGTMRIRLREMADMMSEMSQGQMEMDAEEAPELATVNIMRTESGVAVKIVAK